jgi:hypothetical protein
MWQSISYYSLLAFESAFGVFGIRLYEEPRYEVIARLQDRVEIRRYPPRLAAEMGLAVGGKASRGQAFRILFDYISGFNRPTSKSERIAMTAPVSLHETEKLAMTVPVATLETESAVRMRFFLPAKYTLKTAPEPADPRVKLIEIPEETIATLRYAGSGSDFATYQSNLIAKLVGSRWRPSGTPYTLYYDAPFTIPFFRRNEAAVEVREELPTDARH